MIWNLTAAVSMPAQLAIFQWARGSGYLYCARTAIVKNNMHVQAGAGIVCDSDPGAEYEENPKKARALFGRLEPCDFPEPCHKMAYKNQNAQKISKNFPE
ncbi:MAG: hypothetical protein CM15mP46_3090 [Alphaproteobacteria bacterium]|nr:MAG: hypothetical protein CM15mP46_3090 [Alphaproteobacteria bacterium]